ncbi:hypothetical protein BSKO_10805 [Bryopsis sp. KO-2023]|nr:hypothetical protein BSKO_10805 [Bryopsis sp. KO-2023]
MEAASTRSRPYLSTLSNPRAIPARKTAPRGEIRPGASRSQGSYNVGKEAKQSTERRQLFNRIAPVYDRLNDALSLGQHRDWKKWTVEWSGAQPGDNVLDVCCGSGDIAFLLAEAVGSNGKVTGLDFAAEMLDDASQRETEWRARDLRSKSEMSWVQGDALKLPFGDGEFDAITMGYGLRNVVDIPLAMTELHRVLRPGRRVAILDFNNSNDLVVDSFQGFMLENVVVPVARMYNVQEEYEYLRPSIQRFPSGPQQEWLAQRSGFDSARHHEIMGGLMGILVAQKTK